MAFLALKVQAFLKYMRMSALVRWRPGQPRPERAGGKRAPMQPSAAGLQADLKACTEGVRIADAGTHQLLHTL
jgi:hypothetical protein